MQCQSGDHRGGQSHYQMETKCMIQMLKIHLFPKNKW